ncbi:MAG: tetratricopeptide repeat protein [Candidatus Hermodarchaeota archaeon]
MPVSKTEELELSKIFRDGQYAFLVGAGISRDAPAYLESAKEFSEVLIDYFSPPTEKSDLLKLLRYELIIQVLYEAIDRDFHFLDYLESKITPNLIHFFLANVIAKKNFVITTNFDFFIEYALLKVISDPNKVDVIITKEDFSRLLDPNEIYNMGRFPLVKIHGSIKDILKKRDTRETLVTTLGHLGKYRKQGETFALEEFKKKPVTNILKNRILVVMGYSGSDDFDLNPTLKDIKTLKGLIWIDHIQSTEGSIKIQRIEEGFNSNLKKMASCDSLLVEIALNNSFSVYKISINTMQFIKNYLWDKFLSTIPIPKLDGICNSVTKIDLASWLKQNFQETPLLNKYNFVYDLYFYAGMEKKAYRCATAAYNVATNQQNKKERAKWLNDQAHYFYKRKKWKQSEIKLREALPIYSEIKDIRGTAMVLQNLGETLSNMKKWHEAVKYFEEAMINYDKIDNFHGKALVCNNLGLLLTRNKQWEDAFIFYKRALSFYEQLGDLDGKARVLNNLGMLYARKGEFGLAKECIKEAVAIVESVGMGTTRSAKRYRRNLSLVSRNICP